ncbi:hypothetical protein MNBD_GAMMA12-3938, partial [hydrothermal vent metagenome]
LAKVLESQEEYIKETELQNVILKLKQEEDIHNNTPDSHYSTLDEVVDVVLNSMHDKQVLKIAESLLGNHISQVSKRVLHYIFTHNIENKDDIFCTLFKSTRITAEDIPQIFEYEFPEVFIHGSYSNINMIKSLLLTFDDTSVSEEQMLMTRQATVMFFLDAMHYDCCFDFFIDILYDAKFEKYTSLKTVVLDSLFSRETITGINPVRQFSSSQVERLMECLKDIMRASLQKPTHHIESILSCIGQCDNIFAKEWLIKQMNDDGWLESLSKIEYGDSDFAVRVKFAMEKCLRLITVLEPSDPLKVISNAFSKLEQEQVSESLFVNANIKETDIATIIFRGYPILLENENDPNIDLLKNIVLSSSDKFPDFDTSWRCKNAALTCFIHYLQWDCVLSFVLELLQSKQSFKEENSKSLTHSIAVKFLGMSEITATQPLEKLSQEQHEKVLEAVYSTLRMLSEKLSAGRRDLILLIIKRISDYPSLLTRSWFEQHLNDESWLKSFSNSHRTSIRNSLVASLATIDALEQPKYIENRFYEMLGNDENDSKIWTEFSQWLQDQGNPRGEIIAIRQKMETVEDEDEADKLLDRLVELEDEQPSEDLDIPEDLANILYIEWRYGFMVAIKLLGPPRMSYYDNLEDLGVTIGSASLQLLYELKLSGSSELEDIPQWIRACSRIRKLSLSGNTIIEIPEWIGELKNLEHLDLSSNHITKISESIGGLTKLKELNLAENHLAELPKSLCHLRELRSLNLSDNNLTALPDYILGMPQLEVLAVNDNFLSGYELGGKFELGSQTNDPLK